MSIYRVIENDDLNLFKISLDENKDFLDYIFFAVEMRAYSIVDYLLLNLDLVNKYKEVFGKSLMTICCQNNDLDMMDILLKYNENINGNPISLFNPLEVSVIDKKKEAFEKLISQSVDINFFLPRHNRTVLDTAIMYQEKEGGYEYFITRLKEISAISTRNFSSVFDTKNFKIAFNAISEYLGEVINYYFCYKELKNVIYIGFFNNNTNYFFIKNNNIYYAILLPFDWPINNDERYLLTNYSFFFKFLDYFSGLDLRGLDYIEINDKLENLHVKPNNIKGFQLVEIELDSIEKMIFFSPVESKRKNFTGILNEKDLLRMKYEWPKNKRGYSIYEGFFIDNKKNI